MEPCQHVFYTHPKSYAFFSKRYPSFPCRIMNVGDAVRFNTFLQYHAKFNLVFSEPQFTSRHHPIIVTTENPSGTVVAMAEVMYDPAKGLAEIYNVCTHLDYRSRGYASGLRHAFDAIQTHIGCDMWLAVAMDNPMYHIAMRTYIHMGFNHGMRNGYVTPSGVVIPSGFTELFRK